MTRDEALASSERQLAEARRHVDELKAELAFRWGEAIIVDARDGK